MYNVWMVRSEGGKLLPFFLHNKVVAIGWEKCGNLTGKNKDQIKNILTNAYPDSKAVTQWSSIINTFVNVIKIGDYIVTYDKEQRVYYLGEVISEYYYSDVYYNEELNQKYANLHNVAWNPIVIARDDLSSLAKNTLGGVATVFHISNEVAEELLLLSKGTSKKNKNEQEIEDEVENQSYELYENSNETLKDKILTLSPDDMEELVKEILNAMGYIARRTPKGTDRGIDVFASKDGIGLEEPRIFAEVKHRKGQIGAPEIRSFLGGRQTSDHCLYISTGGFSKEARYEAERSKIPLYLIDLESLAELVSIHYDKFRAEGKVLLPLRKIYLPA